MAPDGMEGQGWGRFMMVEEKKVLNRLNMDSVSSDERIENTRSKQKQSDRGDQCYNKFSFSKSSGLNYHTVEF